MRDLKSTGFTNTKKPYVVFDLNSIDVNQHGGKPSLGIIKTVNNEFGNNPTINQIYKIEVDLPDIPSNIPNLNCYVEDYYLRYFKEKLGCFEIDLKKIFEETSQKFTKIEYKFTEMVEAKSIICFLLILIKIIRQIN